MTLYHYDLPVWVDESFDGWYGRGFVEAFDQYVRTCFTEFGDRVKYWLSINEQNMQIVYGHWLGVCKHPETWFEDQWKVNHIMNLCHVKAVVACHELVEHGKIGPVPGMVPIYSNSGNPMDQIARLNAEEFNEKIWNDFYVHKEYSNFVKNYWKENHANPGIMPGDQELFNQADIDFFLELIVIDLSLLQKLSWMNLLYVTVLKVTTLSMNHFIQYCKILIILN